MKKYIFKTLPILVVIFVLCTIIYVPTTINGATKTSPKKQVNLLTDTKMSVDLDNLQIDTLVGLESIAKKRYLNTVTDASDQDPPSFDWSILQTGTDGCGFAAEIKITFKMNAKPNSINDWITYTTPLILFKPVTFRMEVDNLSLSGSHSIHLDPNCPISLETANDMVTEALEKINQKL